MLQEGYDIFTVGDTAVAVELKVARPIGYPLTQPLRVAHKHSQVYVCFMNPS